MESQGYGWKRNAADHLDGRSQGTAAGASRLRERLDLVVAVRVSVAGAAHAQGTIGKSICIRGELTGDEDLTIEGKVEGKIDLSAHNLTIGSTGRIEAEVGAKKVIVEGEITGNIAASEKVELTASGRVKGDIVSPRVVIADGAQLKGLVDMSDSKATSARPSITSISSGGKSSDSGSSSKSDKPAAKSA